MAYDCSSTDSDMIRLGYKKLKLGEPFEYGHKYYFKRNVPNCVQQVVCDEIEIKGGLGLNPSSNTLFKAQATKPKTLSKRGSICITTKALYKNKNNEITEIYPELGKKYMNYYNNGGDIYYRDCPIFGCKSGTSALKALPIKSTVENFGGIRKTKRKKTKRKKNTY